MFEAAANEYELWYSTNDGASWTFITDGDLGSGSVGSIPDFAQVDNTLFFTNGVVAPRAWNGSALSTAGASGKSPTPTALVNTASGQLNGTYTYKLISIEAAGTRHAGSSTSNSLQYADEQCDLSWTADTDSDVTGYELYRTTGTGATFYFVTFIDGRTTAAYTDYASDLDILENAIETELSAVMMSHTNNGCGGDEPIQIHGESHGQIQVCPIRWERTTISISQISLLSGMWLQGWWGTSRACWSCSVSVPSGRSLALVK